MPPFPHFFSSRLSWRPAQGTGKGTSAADSTRGCPLRRHLAPPPAGGGREPGRGRGLSSQAPGCRGRPASGGPTRRRGGPLRPELWAGSDAGAKGEPTYALLPLAAKTATELASPFASAPSSRNRKSGCPGSREQPPSCPQWSPLRGGGVSGRLRCSEAWLPSWGEGSVDLEGRWRRWRRRRGKMASATWSEGGGAASTTIGAVSSR